MSRKGDRIDRARERRANSADKSLTDLCSFTSPGTEARDGFGEVTTASGSTLSGIPCELLPLNSYERAVGGSVVAGATNKLKLPVTSATMLISGTYSGAIAARGVGPERTFDVTGRLDSSTDLFLMLAINLKG